MLWSSPVQAALAFYVDIYYKWPCVRHTQLHARMHIQLPTGHSPMAFQCRGRKLVSLELEFALLGVGEGIRRGELRVLWSALLVGTKETSKGLKYVLS